MCSHDGPGWFLVGVIAGVLVMLPVSLLGRLLAVGLLVVLPYIALLRDRARSYRPSHTPDRVGPDHVAEDLETLFQKHR